jgi:glycosyltransferase involved in cell wall biosynthesis
MTHLLVVNQDQFGYSIDSYQHCKYLRDEYRITYICWDFNFTRLAMEGIDVIYVPRRGGKPRRLFAYIRAALREMRTKTYDIILVSYFPICLVFPLAAGGRPVILDHRSGYVRDGRLNRIFANALMTFESMFYRHVTVISEGLRRVLAVPMRKSHLLPLGADPIPAGEKNLRDLRLLYVGSLDSRRIPETVQGVDRFLANEGDAVSLSYDIIGFGSPEEEQRLRETIAGSAYGGRITFHGRVPYDRLAPYLARGNVGIAYIPMERRFDCQPPTKLFEYLLAGMVVLATRTAENSRIINRGNGVLIEDTAGGVCEGLKEVLQRRDEFELQRIQEQAMCYSWEQIVNGNLRVYLEKILREQR